MNIINEQSPSRTGASRRRSRMNYDGPDKPDKGLKDGSCNRTRCQMAPAIWYNHGSHAWYCESCRRDIEFDAFNLRDWKDKYEPKLGHPMFETAQMTAERLANTESASVSEPS